MYNVNLTESYFPAHTDQPLYQGTISDLMADAVKSNPDGKALVEITLDGSIGREWTYTELAADADRLARALLGRHNQGDRIAVWAPNIPEWVLMELALARAGMTLVTVNPAFQPRELAYVLTQSDAKALYYIDNFRGNPMGDIAQKVCADLDTQVSMHDLYDHDALYDGGDADIPFPDCDPHGEVQIQYTSGTTGFPKGAVLHHHGLINSAIFNLRRINFPEGGKYLGIMPLFHTAGCALGVLGTIGMAGTQYLCQMFDPMVAIKTISEQRVTHLMGVPTMIVGMVEAYKANPCDMTCLSGGVSGGSMVAPDLVNQVRELFGFGLQIIYGQTETSPLLTTTFSDDTLEDATQTIGQAAPNTEMAIMDPETSKILPVNTVGEICSRGYMNMLGYNNNAEATAATIDKDGWLHTGDLGSMDARGYIKITGRVKEMIIRGGENLFPAEIENAMLEHPDINEICVVGIPDDKWGEVVACFIRSDSPSKPSRDELVKFCRERLSPQKTPLHWIYVTDWPLTGSGKIQRFHLRDQFVAGDHNPL